MKEEINYAAAEIEFIDRESGNRVAYAYPVTNIKLRNARDPETVVREFRAVDGEWQEVTN